MIVSAGGSECTQPSIAKKLGKPTGNRGRGRKKNNELRSREYLVEREVSALMDAARKIGRHCHRDATFILVVFSHGLRVSEAIALRWDQIDLEQGLIHVRRAKRGTPSVHPLRSLEIPALRELRRKYPNGPYVFSTERQGPMTVSTVQKIVTRAGRAAQFSFPVHPHMLRHAIGFKLANDGRDTRAIQHYLGHRNIQHTVRYTELSAGRFKGFWSD